MSYYLKNTSKLNADKMYSNTPTGKFHKDDWTWAEAGGTGGGTPSDTVTTETSHGQTQSAGSSSLYSRGDHTHGTPTNPVTGHESTYNHSQYNTAYSHSQSSHAPSNAQKNSDILKSEIEAVLTGEISSHSHAGGGGGLSQAQVLTRML